MSVERLFVVHGAGADDIGLVERITAPLAAAGANIVDLRQDALHGLFTIYLVADFSLTDTDLERCRAIIAGVSRDTGLNLAAERFSPVTRDPLRKNLLLILFGADKPGVAAAISGRLSRYQANIEFSKMIAREGVFLMELLVDISRATIPLANLEKEIKAAMSGLGIDAVIQSEDVFNKDRRLVVFTADNSLVSAATATELTRQAGITAADLTKALRGNRTESVISLLDDLKSEVLEKVVRSATPTQATLELVLTLKTFGYRVALCGPVCQMLAVHAGALLGLDAAGGFPVPVDPDTQRIDFERSGAPRADFDEARFIKLTAEKEKIPSSGITVIRGAGIRLELDLRLTLELFNSRVLSRDNVIGLLGCCGVAPEGA